MALLLQEDLFIVQHDSGGLFRLGARAYFQIDIRIRDTKLLEETTRHGSVIMLTRMNQTKTQRTAPCLGCVERVDDRRDLHEIGPCPCDQINLLHSLALISMGSP